MIRISPSPSILLRTAARLAASLLAAAPAAAAATEGGTPSEKPTHETTDFELNLTRGGEAMFTLRARRSAAFGGERTELEDVELVAGGGPVPGLRMSARHGTYFPASGDFVLTEQVEVGRRGGLTARLERLVYRAADGTARSEDPIALSDDGMVGSARGMEVTPSDKRVRLKSEVRLQYVESDRAPRRLEVECGALEYFSAPPRAHCTGGVRVTSGDRQLTSQELDLELRETDQRPSSGRATGQASLSLRLEPAPASEGESQPMRGFASGSALRFGGPRIDLDFSPDTGSLRRLVAPEGGEIQLRPLGGAPAAPAPGVEAPDAWRELRAARIEMTLSQKGRGSRILPETLHASGNTRLSWSGAEGTGALFTAGLEARWTADASTIEMARLRGGFRLERPDLAASGEEADLDPAWIELRGGKEGAARVERQGRLLAGARLRLPRGEGEWSGDGGVQVRHRGGAGDSGWSPLGSDGEFWISAERFTAEAGAMIWRFEEHARAWQGSNLIEARQIDIDESARTLAARGEVVTRTVGAGEHEKGRQEGAELVWVRAPRLDYSEAKRCAEYREGVELIHDTSHLAARELDAWLSAGQGRVEKILARGEVKVVYEDALGESERAEYAPEGRLLRLWSPGGTARARRRNGSQALSGMELTFEGSSDRIAVRSGQRGRSWVVFDPQR